jgi:two-component system sensor histidine kinase/response regulator
MLHTGNKQVPGPTDKMKYFARKPLRRSDFYDQGHQLARGYLLALGMIGLLALASLGLLIAQIDSQARYSRMIEQRENQRLLTLHAALFSMLLGPETDLVRRDQYRRTILDALREIERVQQLFPAQTADDPAAAILASQLRWFAERERTLLLTAWKVPGPDLSSFLAAVPGDLRHAFDAALESQHAASQRQSHLYQGLATGAVCVLLFMLVAEARWIFAPLVRTIRRETCALTESRQRLGAVFDTVSEAIIVADAGNIVQSANSEAARVWGYEPEDLIGRTLNSLVLAGRDLDAAAWRAMFPETGRLQTVGTRRDGEPFALELSLTSTLLHDPSHRAPGEPPAELVFTMSARDITERLETERELAAARDAALDAARSKGALVANMNHEVRGPLNILRETINQLASAPLSEEQRGLLENIVAQGDALHAVVDDLLDLSRIESGRLTLEVADLDLRQLVEGTADLVAGRAVQKQVELLAFIAPDVPTALRGDGARLRQVLLNLLGNALTFTRRGEVVLEVSLEAAGREDVTLRFSVRDTGSGIAPADRPRLFRAFDQTEDFSGAPSGSRGLGLTICRQLVERMDGSIDCESTPGMGSIFWFTVPLQKQSPAGAEAAAARRKAENALIASLRDVHVLVVDDNATCRKLLSTRLAAWGMIPATAESGGAALAQLREQALAGTPFDIAMLDLNLGSMDGFTLAWAIHSQPLLAHTRLVLVTALGLEKDSLADQQVGILGSVSKPLKHDTVLQVLAKVSAREDSSPGTAPRGRSETPLVRTPRFSADGPLRAGGRRILLADDNPINRKMTLRQLTNLGFPADAVANGREVLAALRAQPYGLVILDLHMPVLDGYETARTIRRLLEKQRADHLPLVAMTANRTNGDRQRCLEAGMDDYLCKPVRQEDLGRILARWNGAERPPLAAAAPARFVGDAAAL